MKRKRAATVSVHAGLTQVSSGFAQIFVNFRVPVFTNISATFQSLLPSMPPRNWEVSSGSTEPPNVFHGYLACITNQYAASDGDIFSEFFKIYKLGPLIGERTWGGVRGIRGEIFLIDGGYITRPEFSEYNLQSKWVVENRGVVPDIEVDNRPDDVVRGKDAQLERAIQEVMKRIEANPKKLPPPPPDLPAYPEGPGM